MLTCADYTQVELRVLAQVAGEETLREIFRRGEDVHTATAAAIFGIDPKEVDHATRDRPRWSTSGSSTDCRLSASATA